MASLLGSLAGGLGQGIEKMAMVREENDRRQQDKQFQVNMDERRAAREKALAKWGVDQDKEMRANDRKFKASENAKNREYRDEIASSKAAAKQRQQESEKIEKIFKRLDSEYQAKREEILEYAPKDLATGQPQMTEGVQKELARLDQAYQSQQREFVKTYGEKLIGTSYEPYFMQYQGQQNEQPGLLRNTSPLEHLGQPEPEALGNKDTENMAQKLRSRVNNAPAGSTSRLIGDAAEAVTPPRMPWMDYDKDDNVNQKYRGY